MDSATLGYTAQHPNRRVLVTGATGYVGGRVVPELLQAGFTVRAMSRRTRSLERFDWSDAVEHATADITDAEAMRAAMTDVDVVLYLVHSMGSGDEDFEEAEQRSASTFAQAAADAGVSQIIYLSGLHPKDKELDELSKHMRSRERVARTLMDSGVPTMVLRAATLIGSGSASFEIIRHLTERLPFMLAPQWITNQIEPLSIRDALYYLVRGADLDEPVNQGFDIGCGTTYEFADLLRIYAKIRGLRRVVKGLPVPLPVDQLSGAWIGMVTPVPSGLGLPLAQSMAEDAVCEEHSIADIIPDPPGGLADYPTAVTRALRHETQGGVITSWDDSWKNTVDPAETYPTDPDWAGETVYRDERVGESDLPPEDVWRIIEGIGGDSGWYSAAWLWRVRGFADKLIGGPGLGGRRDPKQLAEGDRVDWWRVESIERPRRLVLRAEMRLSGKAWLILEVAPRAGGGSVYTQTAVYVPEGLPGRAYWWAVYPFHGLIFPLMRENILKAASRQGRDEGSA
ncbi:SDR family oxidoreductase [Corynebacterium sp. TAE3-ERU12]|uniref:SDR family oxidoreductase n=1 Tax=Corynebacterium sp. TAE3-ERU12 TaxID=2849491 RepID=UPI001C480B06|nr:SDR family oxidoreductase [Corynebacterium sp. TAE3-ERU12]MBV7296050.1 SDR family oxidoreductase [Corynebacterium sp. TAE3-ERU12]